MDTFGILDPDPDPHENLCGSTLVFVLPFCSNNSIEIIK